MPITSNVVLGTESGVVVLSESGGTWQRAKSYLDGVNVVGLASQGADRMLAATGEGGLFRINLHTDDVVRLGQDVLPKRLHTVTVSPHDPDTVYVGGEPAAVFISKDGGETWRENAAVREIAAKRQWKYPQPGVGNHIRNIIVSWDDPQRIFAAVQVGGILRSDDAGETWTEITAGLDPDVHSMMQHPVHPEIVYAIAGGGGPVGTPGDYSDYGVEPLPMSRPFYRSRDHGRTWECVSADFKRKYGIGIDIVPTTPVTLVAPVARDAPPFWGDRPGVGADAVIMISKDDGTSWQQCTQGLPEPFTMMIEAVEVARSRKNQVFVGTGRDRMKEAGGGSGSVYVCNDVQGNWTRVPLDLPGIAAIVAV